ncbi:MAG: hypothetical protein JNL58_04200 [Planctomyces sp.]|nr:hypothetical protein [Planctomyces sp.]
MKTRSRVLQFLQQLQACTCSTVADNPAALFAKQRRGKRRRSAAGESLEPRMLLTVDLLSVTPTDNSGDMVSNSPVFSRNGRFVAFQSNAEDLDIAGATDGNDKQDVFVRDLLLGTTTLISVTPGGRGGSGDSWLPSISDDGRFVVFSSMSTDLVTIATTYLSGVNAFVRDRDTDKDGIFDEPGASSTYLVSRSGEDSDFSGNSASAGIVPGLSFANRAVISGDGSTIAFVSLATNLLDPGDGVIDPFFLADLYYAVPGGRTGIASVNYEGTSAGVSPSGQSAGFPSLSYNGRRIAFQSADVDLVQDDTEGFQDIFVRDLTQGKTIRVSIDEGDRGGNAASFEPVISRNGNHVVFSSTASNLVSVDSNGASDVFVHDIRTGRTALVSRNRISLSPGSSGNAPSPPGASANDAAAYAISDNGRYVVYSSLATNLLDPADGIEDTNTTSDVFWFDRDADMDGIFDETAAGATRTKLVSVNSAGTAAIASPPGSGGANAITISSDGRYVLFTGPGTDAIEDGTAGTAYYIRDMFSDVTTLVGLSGTPGAMFADATESGISVSPLRAAFASVASDLDSDITDDNSDFDVFSWDAPTNIIAGRITGDGDTTISVGYVVENKPVPTSFEIGVYRSADSLFDPSDELLDTITVSGSGLDIGKYSLEVPIGSGPGELSLPGAGTTETDEDYQLLFVFDHLDTVEEIDTAAGPNDNLRRFQGLYHPAGGAVFAHGRVGPEKVATDSLDVTESGVTTTVRFNRTTVTYPLADVTGIRFRGHEGDDSARTGSTADLLIGGTGSDKLQGGAGDDFIDGGIGNDALYGESGFDTIFDGMGDDLIDLGPDGGVIVSTPGSNDFFTSGGVATTINLARDDQPITLDLDSSAVQTVDPSGNTVQLDGTWQHFVGSPFGDELRVHPLSEVRQLDGGPGADSILIDALGGVAGYDGAGTVTISGFAPLHLQNFEEIRIVNAARRIIDDSDVAGFTHTGFFDSNPAFPQGFNGGVKFSAAGSGNTATWHFTDLVPGHYQVAATWTHAGDRAKDAPFTVRNGGPTGSIVHQVDINQEVAPNDFSADGVNWKVLTTAIVTGAELTVQLGDIADQFVSADAIRIIPMDNLNPSAPRASFFDVFTGEWVDILSDTTVDLGTIARDASGMANTSVSFRVTNDGPGDLHFGNPTAAGAGYTIPFGPSELSLPEGATVELEVAFERNLAGTFAGLLSFTTNLDSLPVYNIHLTVDAVNDSTPPEVRIVAPTGSISFLEGAIAPIRVEATDDLAVERVDFLVNGQLFTDLSAPFQFDFSLPHGQMPPKVLDVQVTAFDVAGNSATDESDYVLDLDAPPRVELSGPLNGANPFAEGSMLPVFGQDDDDILISRVELRSVDGTVISQTTDYPMLPLPQQFSRGPVSFIAVTVDIFGRTTESNVLTFDPFAPLTFTSPDPVPASRVQVNHLTPLLSWNALAGATAYEIFIRNLKTQQTIVPPQVFAAELQLPSPLQQGNHRMWVRAIDGDGNRLPWSDPFDFLIDVPNPSPMKPTFHITSSSVDGTPQISIVTPLDLNEPAELLPFDTIEVFIRDKTAPQRPDVIVQNIHSTILEVPMGLIADDYNVWVRRVNAAGERGPWSDPVPLTINTPQPLAPVVSMPNNTVTNTPLVFEWDAVRYAAHYSVFIRRTDRSATDLEIHNVTGLSWSTMNLPHNGNYKVWVRATTDAGESSQWSSPVDFVIDVPVPGSVTLISPTGLIQGNPTFVWQSASNAAAYGFWLTRVDTNQHPFLVELHLTDTQYIAVTPLPAGTYRFWVRAINASGVVGPWSEFLQFTIDQ